jgi:hypothetical protein
MLSVATNTDFPSSIYLGINKATWSGLIIAKCHTQEITRILEAGQDPDLIATEALAALIWQRYSYLPPMDASPLSSATRIVTIIFLCISNPNGRAFLFDHPNGARSARSVVEGLKACLQLMVVNLDAGSSKAKVSPLLLVWLFVVGAIVSHKMPERQWFVHSLVPVVEELGILTWEEMKMYLQAIMWIEVWHDGVGERVWEETSRKPKYVQILTI